MRTELVISTYKDLFPNERQSISREPDYEIMEFCLIVHTIDHEPQVHRILPQVPSILYKVDRNGRVHYKAGPMRHMSANEHRSRQSALNAVKIWTSDIQHWRNGRQYFTLCADPQGDPSHEKGDVISNLFEQIGSNNKTDPLFPRIREALRENFWFSCITLPTTTSSTHPNGDDMCMLIFTTELQDARGRCDPYNVLYLLQDPRPILVMLGDLLPTQQQMLQDHAWLPPNVPLFVPCVYQCEGVKSSEILHAFQALPPHTDEGMLQLALQNLMPPSRYPRGWQWLSSCSRDLEPQLLTIIHNAEQQCIDDEPFVRRSKAAYTALVAVMLHVAQQRMRPILSRMPNKRLLEQELMSLQRGEIQQSGGGGRLLQKTAMKAWGEVERELETIRIEVPIIELGAILFLNTCSFFFGY